MEGFGQALNYAEGNQASRLNFSPWRLSVPCASLGRHSQSRRADAEAALDLAYQFVQPNAVERVRRGLAPRGLSQGRCRLMEWVSRAPAPPSDGNWPGAQKTSCTPSLSDVAMHTGLPSWVLAVRKRNPIWSSCRAEDRFLCFFALRMTTGPKIPGTVLPRRVFTQPGSKADVTRSNRDVCFSAASRPSLSADEVGVACCVDELVGGAVVRRGPLVSLKYSRTHLPCPRIYPRPRPSALASV